MLKLLKNFVDNGFIQIAGLLALFLSPFADAIGGNSAFWYLFFVLSMLFLIGLFDEYKKNKIMTRETVHIPIIIKVDDGTDSHYVLNNLIIKIEEQINLNNYKDILKKYYSLDLETLIFEYKGSIFEFDRLMSFIRIIKYKIDQIEKELDGRVKFHIAYYRRPAIGFIIGTIFRTQAVTIYQNNDAKNQFEQVANIKDRKYKENVNFFSHYNITKKIVDENDNHILIIINSASHLINEKANSIKDIKNKVIITLKSNGTIPYDSDWIEYSQEIYTIINQLQTKYSKFTIVHAMPEAISIILGMALENYWNINITQYLKNDYLFVYKMNEIKYF